MKIRIVSLSWNSSKKCWNSVIEDSQGRLVYAIDLENSIGRPVNDGELWVIDVDENPIIDRPGLIVVKARLVEPVILDHVQFDKDDRGRVRAIYDFPVGNVTASVMLLLANDQHYLVRGPGKGFKCRAEKLVAGEWDDHMARFKFVVAILKDQVTVAEPVKLCPIVKAAKPKKLAKKIARPPVAKKKPTKAVELAGVGLGDALVTALGDDNPVSTKLRIAQAIAEEGSILVG